ncbi:hypothetical protein [Paenisporosarcina quisquiliarum]|uniref:hypothetical protein n=1 Tax=Paenisporosarcina quisquiliarum TaxID=365346 RepID=UPI003734E9D8
MKKFLIGTIITLMILAGLGYGLYIFGTNTASEKIVDDYTANLEDSGQMNEVRTMIESDPELLAMMEEAKAADPSTLPFTTKGEATRVLVNKLGVSKLKNLQTKAQSGEASKEEILQVLQENLTEEEMLALQKIAYEEIYNQ